MGHLERDEASSRGHVQHPETRLEPDTRNEQRSDFRMDPALIVGCAAAVKMGLIFHASKTHRPDSSLTRRTLAPGTPLVTPLKVPGYSLKGVLNFFLTSVREFSCE